MNKNLQKKQKTKESKTFKSNLEPPFPEFVCRLMFFLNSKSMYKQKRVYECVRCSCKWSISYTLLREEAAFVNILAVMRVALVIATARGEMCFPGCRPPTRIHTYTHYTHVQAHTGAPQRRTDKPTERKLLLLTKPCQTPDGNARGIGKRKGVCSLAW